MVGITQNGQKSLIFIEVPKQRKQLKVLSLTYNYNSNHNNDKSIRNNDNDNNITSLALVNIVFLHHA